ncbi:MAG: hypothetical protein HY445_01875 [Candidatus Niyogibacteria bacterium]|nr:hypothetical protein [Candidatus Niyogibacteria bacterium]
MSEYREHKEQIKKLVEHLKETGFPQPVARGEMELTEKQEILLQKFYNRIDTISILFHTIEKSGYTDADAKQIMEKKKEVYSILEEAVLTDLMKLYMIRDYCIAYGVIPIPQTEWNFYNEIEGGVYCWNCDIPALKKMTTALIPQEDESAPPITTVKIGFFCKICDKDIPGTPLPKNPNEKLH